MEKSMKAELNQSFLICGILIVVILVCFSIHSTAEKERHDALIQKQEIVLSKIDTLRIELKGYHSSITKFEVNKNNLYSEQCRVDSIQDSGIVDLYRKTTILNANN
jgi:hypothetical protein